MVSANSHMNQVKRYISTHAWFLREPGKWPGLNTRVPDALLRRSAHVCGGPLPKSSCVDAVGSEDTGNADLVIKRRRRVCEGMGIPLGKTLLPMWAAWGISGAAKPLRRQSQAVSFRRLVQRPAALTCLLWVLTPAELGLQALWPDG
jgi:hypothetical protein